MTDAFTLLKVAHIVGAAVLLGTGAGIAFFMVAAHRARDPAIVAHAAGAVVAADLLFTASAFVLQPVTGAGLALMAGIPLASFWIAASLLLYAVVGAFWLPVVWLQWRMRDLARAALAAGGTLPPLYSRYYRIWFACGFPALAAVLAIVWLMVAKPDRAPWAG